MNITLTLAWRNLWRHRRRTWLTTGAMVFSNVILVVMISLQLATYDMMVENSLRVVTGHVQIQAPGYSDDPKFRYVVDDIKPLASALRAELDSDKVAARAMGFALASSESRSHGVQLVGVEPAYEPKVSTLPGQIIAGRYLDATDAGLDTGSGNIVLGSVLARNLQVGLGAELTLLGSGLDGSFAAGIVTVVGIFESGMPDLDRGMAQLSLAYFQDLFALQGKGHSVVIEAASLAGVAPLVAKLQRRLGEREDLVVLDWDALQPGLRQAIQADMSSAIFMYLVLVVLVAFSVLNTQLMSVLERTREFGIMMALGLKPLRLGRLVMLETVLMAGLGLILGVLIGGALTLWLGVVGFSYPGMEDVAGQFNMPDRFYPQLTLVSALAGPLVVFMGCLSAALLPAMRLRRMQPVAAMRSV